MKRRRAHRFGIDLHLSGDDVDVHLCLDRASAIRWTPEDLVLVVDGERLDLPISVDEPDALIDAWRAVRGQDERRLLFTIGSIADEEIALLDVGEIAALARHGEQLLAVVDGASFYLLSISLSEWDLLSATWRTVRRDRREVEHIRALMLAAE